MAELRGENKMEPKNAKRIFGLKSNAYREYLSARILFNNDLLQQAAIFANTCIEKELKANLFFLGWNIEKDHNSFSLFKKLKQSSSGLTDKLNSEFIQVLSNIYSSRYYDGLPINYNFVIIRNKFLAELDYTFSILEPTIRYARNNDNVRKTNYEIAIEEESQLLFINNYHLAGFNKTDFLNEPDLVYEFRVLDNHEILEAEYQIPFNTEHKRFKYVGLTPKSDERSFDVSHLPLQL